MNVKSTITYSSHIWVWSTITCMCRVQLCVGESGHVGEEYNHVGIEYRHICVCRVQPRVDRK